MAYGVWSSISTIPYSCRKVKWPSTPCERKESNLPHLPIRTPLESFRYRISARKTLILSHQHHRKWSGRRGSNPRHSAWKADALPTELLPQAVCCTMLYSGTIQHTMCSILLYMYYTKTCIRFFKLSPSRAAGLQGFEPCPRDSKSLVLAGYTIAHQWYSIFYAFSTFVEKRATSEDRTHNLLHTKEMHCHYAMVALGVTTKDKCHQLNLLRRLCLHASRLLLECQHFSLWLGLFQERPRPDLNRQLPDRQSGALTNWTTEPFSENIATQCSNPWATRRKPSGLDLNQRHLYGTSCFSKQSRVSAIFSEGFNIPYIETLVPPVRFERTQIWLKVRCSTRLSYGGIYTIMFSNFIPGLAGNTYYTRLLFKSQTDIKLFWNSCLTMFGGTHTFVMWIAYFSSMSAPTNQPHWSIYDRKYSPRYTMLFLLSSQYQMIVSEPPIGLEPITYRLRNDCSTRWAKVAKVGNRTHRTTLLPP